MGNPQQVKRIEKGIDKSKPVSPEVFAEPTSAVEANDLHTEPAVAGKKTQESSDEALKRANEERLAEIEIEIEKTFSDPEKEFVDLATDSYLNGFWLAKASTERERRNTDDQWANIFRKKYIEKKLIFAKNKDKMGANGPLIAEKAKLLKEYLERKLPKGIPEEKTGTVDPAAGQEKETNSVNVPPTAVPKPDEGPAPDQQSYAFHQGDEFAALSGDWKEKGDFTKISDREKWMKTSVEDLDLNAQLAEMKKEVDEFGKNYSKVAGEAGAKQGIIKKLNPLSNPEDYDEVKQVFAEWVQKRDEFERAFYQDLAMKFSRGEIDEKTVDQLSNNFDTLMIKEGIGAHGQKLDFRKDYSEGKGWISPKIANGYNNFIGKFRKMHPALRIGAGAGIFVIGNIPATMVWRVLGGLAAGKGSQEGLQAAAEIWRQRKERKALQKFEKEISGKNLSVQERINQRLGRHEKQNQGMEQRMAKYARGDYYRKFAGVLIAGLVGSGTVARLIQSTGMGGAIKDKLFGGGAAATQAQEAFYSHGPDGKITGLTPQGDEHFKQYNIEPHDYDKYQKPSVIPAPEAEQPPHQEYSSETRATEGGVNFEESPKSGTFIEEARTSPTTGAESHVPEIAEPSSKLLGYYEVKPGGGIEKSAKEIIKANAKAFGLDPDDPKLNTKAGQKAHVLARGLAEKYGMSYEDLNKIASDHVQKGDQIRIFKDSISGKMNLTYNGAAFENALSPDNVSDISPGGAGAAHEIAPSKGNIPVDDAKPRTTGAVAEHQPSRGGGKSVSMKEIEADYQQDLADRKYARAVRAEQDLSALHARQASHLENVSYEATFRQSMHTRGLLKNIIHEAGIGNNVSLWDESAEKWYGEFANMEKLVSQDVLHNDGITDINKKREILRAIFSQLPKPRPGENTWQAFLRNISEDPNNLVKINRALGRR